MYVTQRILIKRDKETVLGKKAYLSWKFKTLPAICGNFLDDLLYGM